MQDEPEAGKYFESLTRRHKNYFIKWIENTKTNTTKTKQIALTIKAMSNKMNFGTMPRHEKEERRKLTGDNYSLA